MKSFGNRIPPEARGPKPDARHGMVLLVVVIVMALLTLAGYAFVALMNSELDSTRQRGREMQMHYITQSGVSLLESVASLSQIDRNWAGGTYDNSSLFCATQISNDFSDIASARFTVVAPKIESGRMSGIRYGLVNESAKLNLAKVLEWETANPGDGVNALRKLPGMSAQTAEAILDWIDADDQQRVSGAESSWYTQRRLPYKPRNAVPVTLEEFLLVRGVTRQLMFGDDENFNFVPDTQETRMTAMTNSPVVGGTESSTTPAIPWVHLLTVAGAERDANLRGAARIDLNHENLEFLREQLALCVNPETADFVILYRQYGTAELNADLQASSDEMPPPDVSGRRARARGRRNSAQTPALEENTASDASFGIPPLAPPDMSANGMSPVMPLDVPDDLPDVAAMPDAIASTSNETVGSPPPPLPAPSPPSAPLSRAQRGSTSRTTRESRLSPYVNFQTLAKFRLETPLDIVGATINIDLPQQPTISLESPLTMNESSLNSTLLTYLDEVSTSQGTTIIGRININEAPYEVIAGIPGLSQSAAQGIVNRREQPANGIRDMYRHPTWLLAFDLVDLTMLKKLWPHITCGGDVFRAQVIGFYEDIGTFSRVETAIDATVFPPRRIDYKDLTSYGIGFHDRVLFGTIPRQSSMLGSAVGSTAPTLADRSTGGSLADYGADFNASDSMSGMMGTFPGQQSSLAPPDYSNIAPLAAPDD